MGILPLFAGGVIVIVTTVSVAVTVLKKIGVLGTANLSNSDAAELREAVEAVQARLGEMEERLDFAERMLAQYREAERLAPPPE
jgi:hypothetical protein